MSAQLEVHDLRVQRGSRTVVHVPRLEVAAGVIAVVSAAGASGKTSLALALCGALGCSGDVWVGGRRLAGPPSARSRAGLRAAVRDGRVVATCTVRQALTLASAAAPADAALHRLPALATRQAVETRHLSGGEQQLLQVACAWLGATSVLVLDAPTSGVATEAADAVQEMAREASARGVAVVWLEADERAAPAAASWRLAEGALSPL
ncbi:MAG: ATP-binding cassette domain-containing protein [Candidatus Dormibacteria bacterium]